MDSPHAIVITATAPILFAIVWGIAGPWWAVAAIAASLSIAALAEWDERREQRLRRHYLDAGLD